MFSHSKGLWRVALLAALMAIIGSACGGGGGVAPTTAPAGTPAPATQAPAKPSGDPAAGEKAFNAQGCSACHQAKGAGGQVGPRLDGVYGSKVKLITGQEVTADDAYIRESIVNPSAKVVAGFQPTMPSTYGSLPPQDLSNLIAFIASLTK